MVGRLNDKIALVTGGGSGIGRAICLLFAAEGARVAVADIDGKKAAQTAAELSHPGLAVEIDVAAAAAVRPGVARVYQEFGRLDILVNNAGYLVPSSFEECSEELWDRTIDINLKGAFLCARAVVPQMRQQQSGVIINMTSLAAKTGGQAASPPYAAAKAGLIALTLHLARSLAPHQVRVNGIAPGLIETAMTRSPGHARMAAQIPLGEMGKPEDVARCALFLASEEARHITGEIIDVNGGLFMD